MNLEETLFPSSAFQTTNDVREGVRQLLRDIGRIVSPHGIDTGRYVTIGGVEQWVAIRGQDRRAPVLLFLHGGPNTPASDIAYAWQRPWEDYFVVVNWDQRGCGRSTPTPDQARQAFQQLTKQRLIDDALELVGWLCEEFGQRRILVVGQSWGTVLALELAARHPEKLHLVVLQGLAVEWLASAEKLRLTLIDQARCRGDEAEAKRLTDLGPVPPATEPDAVMAWVPRFGVGIPDRHTWHNIAGDGDGWARRMDLLRYVSPDLPAEDYDRDKQLTLQHADLLHARHVEGMKAAMTWNAPSDVGVHFEVPIVVMQGAHDWQTWTEIARGYFEKIVAPWKQWIEFPYASHALNIEQPGLTVVNLVIAAQAAIEGRVPAGAVTGQVRCATHGR